MPHVRSRDQATANWQLAALNYFTSPALKEATEGQNSEWLSGISTGLVLKIFREIPKKTKQRWIIYKVHHRLFCFEGKRASTELLLGGGGGKTLVNTAC